MDVSVLPLLAKYKIGLHPKFLAANPTPGHWVSPYSGQGAELLSLRDYQPGDDIRRLRPGESLRTGKKIIGERAELRDVTIVVVVDCSPSMMLREKWEAQRRIASLILFSAWKSESTFALALGNSQFARPRSGEKQFQLAYKVLYEHECPGIVSCCKNDWAILSREMRGRVPPKSMVFILSDFLESMSFLELPPIALRALSDRYDMIAVCLQDDLEYSFSLLNYGISSIVEDAETGQQEEVWLSPRDQERIRQLHSSRLSEIREKARSAGMSWVHVPNSSLPEMYRTFSQFFEQRKRH